MEKHAYLIMAHENPGQLRRLLQLLDDERNDLYVHIDKNAGFSPAILNDAVKKTALNVLEQHPVYWADYSMVTVELLVIERALKSGCHYRYLHLLSGMDLPIKTQDEIHRFFGNKTAEFLGIVPVESAYDLDHVRYSYPLLHTGAYRKHKAVRALSGVYVLLQRLVKRDLQAERNDLRWRFYDGWNWFSITEEFAAAVMALSSQIEKVFQSAKAPDEMFLQTVAYNSPFRERIYDTSSLSPGSARLIDWNRGKPYVFRSADFEELINSPCILARKFDERVDAQIIERIFCRLSKEQEAAAGGAWKNYRGGLVPPRCAGPGEAWELKCLKGAVSTPQEGTDGTE